MSNTRTPAAAPETIDTLQLDDVTGGCGACRCNPCGGIGGVAYSRNTGFGIDPLFMMFAMQLFSQSSSK